jgi:adenine-specific DNA methylase
MSENEFAPAPNPEKLVADPDTAEAMADAAARHQDEILLLKARRAEERKYVDANPSKHKRADVSSKDTFVGKVGALAKNVIIDAIESEADHPTERSIKDLDSRIDYTRGLSELSEEDARVLHEAGTDPDTEDKKLRGMVKAKEKKWRKDLGPLSELKPVILAFRPSGHIMSDSDNVASKEFDVSTIVKQQEKAIKGFENKA